MTLRYDVEDAVATITLARPDVLNAFDDDLGLALTKAIVDASKDRGVRCIVITGEGRGFSSGEDLGALAEGYERGETPDLGDTLVRRYNPLIESVVDAPKPVVAALNGVAAGAGASLALACDFRVASVRAKIVIAFVKVGLVPDSGALWFLTKMIGSARAFELAMTGKVIGADEALTLGLVTHVLDEATFEEGWRAFARDLAQGPTLAYAEIKRLARAATEVDLARQLELEIAAQTTAGKSDDHLEGVRAFLGKRPPNFKGS